MRRPGSLIALVGIAGIGLVLVGCGGASATPSPQDQATRLSENDAALRSAIDGWRAGGDPPTAPPPREVLDRARDLQSLTAKLAARPNLAQRVIPLAPRTLGLEL